MQKRGKIFSERSVKKSTWKFFTWKS